MKILIIKFSCESEERTVPYVLKFLINLFINNYKILNR
jgi:hypothetical protein